MEATIQRYLQTEGLSITVYDTLASTNVLAKQRGEEGAPEGTVIIASHQTAGKGTRGRSFYSPEGTGLYMSVLLRPAIRVTQALAVTTAAAVAVCRAIETVSAKTPLIKWVNDIYCDGKKVCGILTEASLQTGSDQVAYVVLGIGVNVSPPKDGFPAELQAIAGTVFDDEGDVARLAAAILDAFFAEYAQLSERRFVQEYRERSLVCGREITVVTPQGDRRATAVTVDEECRLCVRYDDGETAVLSFGDVSVRL